MMAIANFVAHRLSNLYSVEMWGGATFDVAMRFLHEDPWQRLRRLREAIPNICFQMLLRASNAVGYTAYPDNVVRAFVEEAARQGIDIFRVKTLRDEVGIPIHFHTHDTSGINAASVLKASDAGVDVADGAIASMSGQTSQPNLNSMVAALAHTKRETGLDLDALNVCADYWEAVRAVYAPFDTGPPSGTAEVSTNITEVMQAATTLGGAAAEIDASVGELSTRSARLRSDVHDFLETVR